MPDVIYCLTQEKVKLVVKIFITDSNNSSFFNSKCFQSLWTARDNFCTMFIGQFSPFFLFLLLQLKYLLWTIITRPVNNFSMEFRSKLCLGLFKIFIHIFRNHSCSICFVSFSCCNVNFFLRFRLPEISRNCFDRDKLARGKKEIDTIDSATALCFTFGKVGGRISVTLDRR